MSTSRQACAWIVGVVLACPSAAGAQDRSELAIVELIVREGPQAVAIRAGAEVVRREQLARQAPTNPSVSYSREGAGFAEFLQVEQALGFLGTRQALSRAGAAAVTAAEAERDGRLWRLRSDAMASTARLAAAERRRDVAAGQIRELERLLGILRTREQEGESSRLDRVRAEHELREARSAATDAAGAIAEARASLAAMLPAGTTPGSVALRGPDDSGGPTLDTLLARSAAARPELRALDASGARAVAEGDAARHSRLPLPTVFGGIKRGDDGPARRTGGLFGLSIAVPLFDAGSRDGARWDAERLRLEAERRWLEHQIRSEVRGAFDVWTARQAALSESGDAGVELMQIAEVAYREGEIGILELLDAVRTVSRARNRQINRSLDARLAQIAVERAVGDVVWP